MINRLLDINSYTFGGQEIVPELGSISGINNSIRHRKLSDIRRISANIPEESTSLDGHLVEVIFHVLTSATGVSPVTKQKYVPFNPDTEPSEVRDYVNSILDKSQIDVDNPEDIVRCAADIFNSAVNQTLFFYPGGLPDDFHDLVSSMSKTWLMTEDYRDFFFSYVWVIYSILENLIDNVQSLINTNNTEESMKDLNDKMVQQFDDIVPHIYNMIASDKDRLVGYIMTMIYTVDLLLYKS